MRATGSRLRELAGAAEGSTIKAKELAELLEAVAQQGQHCRALVERFAAAADSGAAEASPAPVHLQQLATTVAALATLAGTVLLGMDVLEHSGRQLQPQVVAPLLQLPGALLPAAAVFLRHPWLSNDAALAASVMDTMASAARHVLQHLERNRRLPHHAAALEQAALCLPRLLGSLLHGLDWLLLPGQPGFSLPAWEQLLWLLLALLDNPALEEAARASLDSCGPGQRQQGVRQQAAASWHVGVSQGGNGVAVTLGTPGGSQEGQAQQQGCQE
ncbi:hypothetical protein ABPG75_005582 [Micractinium tetrahymenae]